MFSNTLKGNTLLALSFTILLGAIWFNARHLYIVLRALDEIPVGSHSYRELDFPSTFVPMKAHPYSARMIIDDTAHYAPDPADGDEWHALFPPGSEGFVRLGPQKRLFGVSMFHQLHCLMRLQGAVFNPPTNSQEQYHASHCLNYLREAVLCSSNMRLEPFRPDPETGRDKVNGIGLEHTCRDWTMLRGLIEDNYKTWPDVV